MDTTYVKKLDSEASKALLGTFRDYQAAWDQLVTQDRLGRPVRPTCPVSRDYSNRRLKATHPLRKRSWKRTTSIPVPKSCRPALKRLLGLDWRKVTKPRLVRFGSTVALSYVQKGPRKHPIERDPRCSNVGICLTKEGMTLRVQSPMDTFQDMFIPAQHLTRAFLNHIVQQAVGRIHVVGLDPTVPASMRDVKSYLTRRFRNAQAEGAISFRSPRRATLGEKYLTAGRGTQDHANLWKKKLLKPHAEYFHMQGLTGEPLLAKESEQGLVGVDGRQISPLARANDVLQSVLAKLDLWPSATFLRRRDRQRVQNAFRRFLLLTTAATKQTTERAQDTSPRRDGRNPVCFPHGGHPSPTRHPVKSCEGSAPRGSTLATRPVPSLAVYQAPPPTSNPQAIDKIPQPPHKLRPQTFSIPTSRTTTSPRSYLEPDDDYLLERHLAQHGY